MIPERKKMGRKTQTEKPQKITAAVQTARGGGHPFGVIDRHRPLTRPEFAVYDAIREAVPIVDAAIGKIIRLIGGFTVKCGDKEAENELSEFLKTVPTGICTCGIQSFLGSMLDSMLMYGTAVGEMVISDKTGRLQGLYNAPLDGLEIKRGDSPFCYSVAVRDGGKSVTLRHPERVILCAAGATSTHPEDRSLLDGLPFVTSVLLKIYDSIGNNFERVGNLRYAVTYKPGDGLESAYGSDRAAEIAREWSSAMSGKDGVRDFVAVGDVDIKVIGADNQVLDSEIPVRQMLEQIIAKTGIPPFMLGLSWSSTERMSSEQSDMLTSELEYYRRLLDPVVERICKAWLRGEGYTCEPSVVWDDITLKDEVELAKARLYRAQAAVIEENGGETE